MRDFADALSGASAGVFFYAGHGLQVAGVNYLVPVDAKLTTASALDWEMVRVDLIQRTMERETQSNVLFLDACRDNPLARNLARAMGTRSADIGRGLAPTEAGVGTLISFSTQPGNVALDGTGRNSPFSSALVKRIATSKDDLSALLIDVRTEVVKKTQGKQVPWEHSALMGRFYFSGKPAPPAPVPEVTEAAREWARVSKTSVADLEAFARRYKTSPEADYAHWRIDSLKQKAVAIAPTPGPSRKSRGGFDGVWSIHRLGPGCVRNTDKVYVITINGEVVGGETGTGPITGTVTASGELKISHTGINARKRRAGTVIYSGWLQSDNGSGTFDKPGTTCRGTFTVKRSTGAAPAVGKH